MEQRIKKAKLFRTLKVIYYCLGMPLFLLAVMALASQIYGRLPFAGNPGFELFDAIKVFFNSPAMYSVWIALAMWIFIGIIQIVCHFCIRNRRTRGMIVVAIMLVVLLLPVFVIDAVYDGKIAGLQATIAEDNAFLKANGYDVTADDYVGGKYVDGVVVEDYKYQLSWYRTHTGGGTTEEANGKRTSLTDTLIKNVEDFLRVYNVDYYGEAKAGKNNNKSNEGLTYADLDYDYNANGVVGDEGDQVLICIKPGGTPDEDGRIVQKSITLTDVNGANQLEIVGDDGFYAMQYDQVFPGNEFNIEDDNLQTLYAYVWYYGSKLAYEFTDGAYGNAIYNKNGLISDGYVFSTEVALNILEAYYEAKLEMASAYAKYAEEMIGVSEAELQDEILTAAEIRRNDYYTSSDSKATAEEKRLFAKENDFAVKYSLTADELNEVLGVLGEELGTAKLLENLLPTVSSLIDLTFTVKSILGLVLKDMPKTIEFAVEKLGKFANYSLTIGWAGDHLAITVADETSSELAQVDINDTFSVASLKKLLKSLDIDNNMLAEIIGLLGLAVKNESGENTVAALESMLEDLLASLYWYSSPVIKPTYMFYAQGNLADDASDAEKAQEAYAKAWAKYEQAYYEGNSHGYMAGCRLIGSSLGDGTYGAEFGLASLQEVQQLKLDVSYKTEMYSILIVRDMSLTFAAIAIFFTAMFYIAADREILYATGQISPKKKKEPIEEENNEEVA